ncbi:MAG TPA: alpha/beta hydrolase-fold protein [Anaerolineales bacterium]|nr:alpha/beta hydrolase-fold protein [Anaerolineales bacterium]
MEHILQTPSSYNAQASYPFWLVLHGAYANAEKALATFGAEAEERATFLLAPQATRPCGDGYCWSYARDAKAIHELIEATLARYPIDRTRLSLIGHSMGCVMALWLMAQNPRLFRFFAAVGMGSPFERWEYDDGGVDQKGLSVSASFTPILLAVDQSDPARAGVYFEDNLLQLRRLGFKVETFRPDAGTHDLTEEMKTAVLQAMS